MTITLVIYFRRTFPESCESRSSLSYLCVSAPCAPANASGHLDCVTNAAWVSWQEAPGAHGYTVLAVGEDGHNSSCTATNSNTTCSVPDLGCGNRYTFHVIATHHHCMSPPSPAIEMETGRDAFVRRLRAPTQSSGLGSCDMRN